MENYVAFLMIVGIGYGLLDLLTDRWPALQRQLFPLLLLIAYGLFVIRYYYGPDIWIYVPHYENIPQPAQLLAHPKIASFEWGYDMFCSLVHQIGASYWGLTAIITTLYFSAIALLLRKLPTRRIFALGAILMLDCHMIVNENRECLAISFFIFMVLLLQNRKYLWAFLFAFLTVLAHKSGFLPVGLLLMSVLLYNYRQKAGMFSLLTVLLILMIVLPVQRISGALVQQLPLPDTYIVSIEHHLQLGRQIQLIGVIYLLVLFAVNMFLQYGKKTRFTWIALVALCGMAAMVMLYQYYYLLNRVRSYFVPFVVYYIILLMSDEERSRAVPHSSLIKQALMILLMVYHSHAAVSQIKGGRLLHEPMPRACTVLELRHATSKQIRDRQMRYAYMYWTLDYMKSSDNKL